MSSPSGFLPAIKTVKSSLPAARRIYAAMDYLDEASKKRLHKKRKRKAVHKRPRTTSPKKDVAATDPSTRAKEYSKELRARKEKARIAKAKEDDCRKQHEELKVIGVREKTRINRLFAIYSTQQESSYRTSARVTRPKFPNLFKATKGSPKGKPESLSPMPSSSLVGNKMPEKGTV